MNQPVCTEVQYFVYNYTRVTLLLLVQLDKRQSAEREAAGSNPSRTNTQGLKFAEKKLLPS